MAPPRPRHPRHHCCLVSMMKLHPRMSSLKPAEIGCAPVLLLLRMRPPRWKSLPPVCLVLLSLSSDHHFPPLLISHSFVHFSLFVVLLFFVHSRCVAFLSSSDLSTLSLAAIQDVQTTGALPLWLESTIPHSSEEGERSTSTDSPLPPPPASSSPALVSSSSAESRMETEFSSTSSSSSSSSAASLSPFLSSLVSDPSPVRASCYQCYCLFEPMKKDQRFQTDSKLFCSESCQSAYLNSLKFRCSNPNCSRKFLKADGYLSPIDHQWYCGEACSIPDDSPPTTAPSSLASSSSSPSSSSSSSSSYVPSPTITSSLTLSSSSSPDHSSSASSDSYIVSEPP